jgi:hypothetical protein
MIELTPRIRAGEPKTYENTKFMKKQDVNIGAFYDWGGCAVEVIGIEPDGIVIECPEVGQDIVKPSSLKNIVPTTSEPVFYAG